MNEKSNILPNTALLWQYRDLVRNLVNKEIKVYYMGTWLGFAWSLASSLVTTLIYIIVFTFVFRSPEPNQTLLLITGLVHWTFFFQLISRSPTMLIANANLIKKVYFPHVLIPFSTLLVALILWLSFLAIFLLFLPLLGGHFTPVLLIYPFYLILFVFFTWGLSMTVAILHADLRDTEHLVGIALQILFWATPIVYPMSFLPAQVHAIVLASPLAEFVVIFRDLFYHQQLPSLGLTVCAVLWTLTSLSLGLWLFSRRLPLVVERL